MENELTQNMDIIMVGIQPWDVEIGSNFKNMAIELSLQYRVLYVNKPIDRISTVIRRSDIKTINRLKSIRKSEGVLEEVRRNLFVFNPQIVLESINWIPSGKLYTFFNKRNNKKLARQISSACKKLNFKNSLLINDNDFNNGLYLKEYLQVDNAIYYLRDFLLSQPYFFKHGVKSEPLILKKYDIVLTNSLYLKNYAKKYNPQTFYIGQGCEVEEFLKKPAIYPADIVDIQKPVIGYCGALLSLRLDIDLLISIALERPYWNLVLVGPEDADFRKSKLHQLPNVFFMGSKEPSVLPAYIHYFDVCINPQVINQMTIGNYPRKIDEYLAAGKPVVATDTEAMEEFADITYLCRDLSGYLSAIEKALETSENIDFIKKRIQVAKTHTWRNSIMMLYASVNQILNKKYEPARGNG
jgi:teichuronic acid biosynthesis glycosyltransferase TuaH